MSSHPAIKLGFNDPKYCNCPLMRLMRKQMGYGDLPFDVKYAESYRRIDEVTERLCADLELGVVLELNGRLQRVALAAILKPVYKTFSRYLDTMPGVRNVTRLGFSAEPLEWYALHKYLMEHGISEEAVQAYIALDQRDRALFEGVRLSCAEKFMVTGLEYLRSSHNRARDLQKACEPIDNERYRYLLYKPNVSD